MKKNFSSAIAKNGQIYVNNHFQIIGSDPATNPKAEALASNIFAFGDCCRTSINEVKNIPSIKFLAQFLESNLQKVVSGKTDLVSIPDKIPLFAAVSIGPSYGLFVMGDNVMPGDENGKAKYQFAETWVKVFKGDYETFKGNKAYMLKTYSDMGGK